MPRSQTKKCRRQAIPPSSKCKAALGTGSRQQHRTPKKATHTYVKSRNCWAAMDLLISLDGSRSATKEATPSCCLIYWPICGRGTQWNPWTRKRQGHLHKDPSNVLPRLSFLPWSSLHGLDPYRKQSEPGRWHLRWVHNRWVHKQPPKVIKYYFL